MILLLHKVHPSPPVRNENWSTPDQLEEFVRKHRDRIVPLREYADQPLAIDFRRVVTFDGVYECVYEHAFPILRRYGVPFELFVTWGSIGETNEWDRKEPPARFADWRMLWEMCTYGRGRVQSHTFSHPDLTRVSDEALTWELANPLGCEFVAYPYGRLNGPVVEAAKRAGYRGGVSVRDDRAGAVWSMRREFLT